MAKRIAHCRECGIAFEAKQAGQYFCKVEHRKAWNNRRYIRGAELYDLMMAHNYERDKRSKLDLWSLVFRLLRAYRDADVFKRNGRKSWDAEETVQRIPLGFGEEGDKR